jgi:hypothetical protein
MHDSRQFVTCPYRKLDPTGVKTLISEITGKRQLDKITGRSDGNNVAVGLNDGTVESVRSGWDAIDHGSPGAESRVKIPVRR